MRSATVLIFLLPSIVAQQSPHLIYSRSIGEHWGPDANRWMHFVAISSDGRMVAGNGNVPGGKPGVFGLWKFQTGEFLRSVAGSPVAISSDFSYLATASSIRNLQTGQNIFEMSREQGFLTAAAFSPNGRYVAIISNGTSASRKQGGITVLNTADGSVLSKFGARFAGALAFYPDSQIVASGHWNNITLWDIRTGAKLALLMSPPRPADPSGYNRDGRYIEGLAFSRDGTMLAAGSDDGELQIWEVAKRKLVHALKIGWANVSDPAFNPDGKLVAAGTYGDGTISLVDVSSGTMLSQIQVSMFGCGSVTFSPDGQYLITPSNGGLLKNGKHDNGGSIRVFRVAQQP